MARAYGRRLLPFPNHWSSNSPVETSSSFTTDVGSIDIKYVPEKPDLRPDVRAVEKLLQSEFNTQLEVRLMPVDRIERGPGERSSNSSRSCPTPALRLRSVRQFGQHPFKLRSLRTSRFRLSKSFFAILVRRSRRWRSGPGPQVVAWQADQLGQLALFSSVELPFYAERLAPLFRKGGTPDFSAWYEVPAFDPR